MLYRQSPCLLLADGADALGSHAAAPSAIKATPMSRVTIVPESSGAAPNNNSTRKAGAPTAVTPRGDFKGGGGQEKSSAFGQQMSNSVLKNTFGAQTDEDPSVVDD